MIAYAVLYFGLTSVAFALAYMYYDQENSKYEKLKIQVYETAQRNLEMYKKNKEVTDTASELHLKVVSLEGKVFEMQTEVNSVQEHCQKLKCGQIELHEKISKKRPKISIPKGPIQIEILGPTKKKGKDVPPPLPQYTPPKNLGKKKEKVRA